MDRLEFDPRVEFHGEIHVGHFICPRCAKVVEFKTTDFDFRCPGCAAPVRIVYEPWEFAMGCYAFTVTAVLESEG